MYSPPLEVWDTLSLLSVTQYWKYCGIKPTPLLQCTINKYTNRTNYLLQQIPVTVYTTTGTHTSPTPIPHKPQSQGNRVRDVVDQSAHATAFQVTYPCDLWPTVVTQHAQSPLHRKLVPWSNPPTHHLPYVPTSIPFLPRQGLSHPIWEWSGNHTQIIYNYHLSQERHIHQDPVHHLSWTRSTAFVLVHWTPEDFGPDDRHTPIQFQCRTELWSDVIWGVQSCFRKGSPRLRWEHSLKRDLR